MKRREVDITIVPRPHFRAYLTRSERFSCIVAHRRAGKTYGCIQDLLARALTHKRQGPPLRYGYIAPTRDQAKDITWGYLTAFTQDIPGVLLNKADLSLTLPNGAAIRLYSGDSYDRMRGLYFDGVVIDEPADIDPDAWPFVIRPCLSDYAGWATFIGTPKGQDAFYDIWKESAGREDWYSLVLRASESGIIPAEELVSLRAGMPDYAFRQEYECDFTAPIPGAIYAAMLDAARETGRIGTMPVDPNHLVHTVWDLGAPQQTVCWYFQNLGRTIRFIDVDDGGEETIIQRVARMRGNGYLFGSHYFPHDALQTERTGRTLATEFAAAWLKQNVETTVKEDELRANMKFIPRTHDIWVGINRAKQLFSSFEFREPNTAAALALLGRYRTKPDRDGQRSVGEPVHDRSSHVADPIRYLAEAELAGMIPFKAAQPSTPEWTYMNERRKRRGAVVQRVGG